MVCNIFPREDINQLVAALPTECDCYRRPGIINILPTTLRNLFRVTRIENQSIPNSQYHDTSSIVVDDFNPGVSVSIVNESVPQQDNINDFRNFDSSNLLVRSDSHTPPIIDRENCFDSKIIEISINYMNRFNELLNILMIILT